jgi:predicted HTH transcriptional regulator
MTITGAGPQVELFNNRLEVTNPGKSLNDIDRIIDLPPRSRNEGLAGLMRRMGLCEEQGSGMDKIIYSVEEAQLPAPIFRTYDNSAQVKIKQYNNMGDQVYLMSHHFII